MSFWLHSVHKIYLVGLRDMMNKSIDEYTETMI